MCTCICYDDCLKWVWSCCVCLLRFSMWAHTWNCCSHNKFKENACWYFGTYLQLLWEFHQLLQNWWFSIPFHKFSSIPSFFIIIQFFVWFTFFCSFNFWCGACLFCLPCFFLIDNALVASNGVFKIIRIYDFNENFEFE